VHVTVTSAAPDPTPKTRYNAHLDDRDMWPVSYALVAWTPEVECSITQLVRSAVA
jgi:hypothetical protein